MGQAFREQERAKARGAFDGGVVFCLYGFKRRVVPLCLAGRVSGRWKFCMGRPMGELVVPQYVMAGVDRNIVAGEWFDGLEGG